MDYNLRYQMWLRYHAHLAGYRVNTSSYLFLIVLIGGIYQARLVSPGVYCLDYGSTTLACYAAETCVRLSISINSNFIVLLKSKNLANIYFLHSLMRYFKTSFADRPRQLVAII